MRDQIIEAAKATSRFKLHLRLWPLSSSWMDLATVGHIAIYQIAVPQVTARIGRSCHSPECKAGSSQVNTGTRIMTASKVATSSNASDYGMTDCEHYFHVVDPQVLGQRGARSLILRFQTVETRDGQPGRSGKYVNLALNNAFAMQLLGTLRALQESYGYPDPGQATQISIPPLNERH